MNKPKRTRRLLLSITAAAGASMVAACSMEPQGIMPFYPPDAADSGASDASDAESDGHIIIGVVVHPDGG